MQDASKALIPGVSITAINVETNVTQTQVSNESGAYSFPVLQPGTYRVSAELPGFKKQVFNDVRLGVASQSRIDFTLQVGDLTSIVEVSSTADAVLRESSASVGDVLSQERIMALPLVGNNVLDLLNTLPGINISPDGEINNTVNGLGINTINVTRDGLQINDIRTAAQDAAYTAGYKLFSPTTLLPDLVGEIRMILSPADAELGRGNSQIQISTRSGTNRYTGSATWNVRNTALDANTWSNNNDVGTAATGCKIAGQTPPCWNPTKPAWNNNHQYTISYGGPVRIPKVYDGTNKTFFYALWEQNINNARETTNVTVLTDAARNGVFRYFTGYNPSGYNPNTTIPNQTFPLTASSATWVAVDYEGRPVAPPFNPDGSAYTGRLICFSVFGNRRLDGNGNMVPFTNADCPAGLGYTAQAVLGPAAGGTWDPFRTAFDTSGYIQKYLALSPRANYFGSNDGLNIAQYRFQRGRGGSNSTQAIVGADLYSNNKQFNLRLDQNFSSAHKVSFSYTTQRDNSADNVASYPDGVNGAVVRKPYVITANVTSTLSPRMINEARFGLNHAYNYDVYAWFNPNKDVRSRAEELLLQGSQSVANPDFTYLAVVNNFGALLGAGSNGPMATTGTNILQFNELWNYADTLSWSVGKHSFKIGGEMRLPRTNGNGGTQPYPSITLGNASNTATPNPWANVANFSTELPGLLNSTTGVTGAINARTTLANLLYFLSGSVATATQPYWVTSNDNVVSGLWSDTSTHGDKFRKQIVREGAIFFKDDYKIARRLTLNLGLRWEYSGSPYIDGGFTSAVVDQGYGAFGPTRTAQSSLDAFHDDPFSIWMRPGNLYLTGYGSSTTTPLSCQRGVVQNGIVSTCDPDSLSAIRFVGPGSPNPGVKAQPVNYHDIGPAVGFSYQLPWFGEGKTTIRAGYQQTFGAGSVNRGALFGGTEAALGNAPGVAHTANLNINDAVFQNILGSHALSLGDVKAIIPVRPTLAPGDTIPIYRRAATVTVYDPNLYTPYTQNVNFSITRQLQRNITIDLRYVGTFARKQTGQLNLNTNNVYHNPELFQALTDARAGTCTAGGYPSYTAKGINPCDINNDPVLLDQLLAGLNLNTTVTGAGGFAAVGTNNGNGVFQTGAQHLRRAAAFQQNLAYGDFNAVANSLLALAPTAAQGRQGTPIDPTIPGGQPLSGIQMTGLRNGCDRIGNGYTIVQQTSLTGGQVANTGSPIPLRCFPEDWLITNPQYNGITYTTNLGHTNYHSMQASVTTRPIHGFSGQATWTWAKSMIQPTSNYFDPAKRDLNFGAQNINAHALRTNGTIELPVGPNKLLLGNTSGWVARLLERWQTSFIANVTGGAPASITPGFAHYYTTSRYNRGPGWQIPNGKVEWNVVNPTTGTISGSYYGNPSPFLGVIDPQCLDPNMVTRGDRMGTNLSGYGTDGRVGSTGAVCNVFALAKRNPDGSQGEYLLTYSLPGTVGDSGNANVKLFGRWTLDMNAQKSFRVSESKTVQVRIDATNVLNHPIPSAPTLGASNLGAIAGKGGQRRQLQGQVRLTF